MLCSVCYFVGLCLYVICVGMHTVGAYVYYMRIPCVIGCVVSMCFVGCVLCTCLFTLLHGNLLCRVLCMHVCAFVQYVLCLCLRCACAVGFMGGGCVSVTQTGLAAETPPSSPSAAKEVGGQPKLPLSCEMGGSAILTPAPWAPGTCHCNSEVTGGGSLFELIATFGNHPF